MTNSRCPMLSVILLRNNVFLFLTGLSARISPKSLVQYRGQYVVFHCYVTGNPLPIVSWYSKGRAMSSDSRATTSKFPGGYIMKLGPVHHVFDNATIECRAANGVDPPVADKAELRIRLEVFRKFYFILSSTAKYCVLIFLARRERGLSTYGFRTQDVRLAGLACPNVYLLNYNSAGGRSG